MNKPNAIAKDEAAYLMGANEPLTSSVLISNSKYLNNPLFRDVYSQFGLKRDADDLPPAYLIPTLSRAFGEVTDWEEVARLVAEERERLPEFAAWLDERFLSNFSAESVAGYAPGTLGAEIHAFIAKTGYSIDFMFKGEPKSDLEYMTKRRAQNHDIEHMVTGFCPSQVGEIALIVANAVSCSAYFRTDLAREMNNYGAILTSTAVSRAGLHYPAVLPALFEGIGLGYTLGSKQKRPLFMTRWEDYLDWTIADIREEFALTDGPPPGYWDWVFEAFRG